MCASETYGMTIIGAFEDSSRCVGCERITSNENGWYMGLPNILTRTVARQFITIKLTP